MALCGFGLLVGLVSVGELLVQRLGRGEARLGRQPCDVIVAAKGNVAG